MDPSFEDLNWSFNRKSIRLTLGLLLLIAFLLRLYKLNSGMWLDEILTYTNYAKLPYLQIITTFDSENQHFLYSILAHTSFLIFGESAWALRLPAVLFGLASLMAVYLLGLEITKPREAFFSLALLTFSYHHIWFSQDARGYTGLLFWTIISSWLFLRLLVDHRPRIWIFYACAAVLGLYTQLTMIFVIASHFIIYIFNMEPLRVRWKAIQLRRSIWLLIGSILVGVLIIALSVIILPRFTSVFLNPVQLVSQGWNIPLRVINEIIKALGVGSIGLYLLGMVVIFSTIGFFSYSKSEPIVVWLVLLPIILSTMVSILLSHFIWPRFYFYLFGFGVFFLLRGIEEISKWIPAHFKMRAINPNHVATYMSAALILISAATVPFAYGPKQDYAGALNYIQANQQANDGVVAIGFTLIPFRDYYHQDWQMVTTVDELRDTLQQHQRVWVIYTLETVLDSQHPELMNYVRQNIPVVKQINGTLTGGEIKIGLIEAGIDFTK
jgi:mannosyltransferase